MITCHLRYRLDLERIDDFRAYARIWISLIERHGGTHFGYFLAVDVPELSQLSFPGIGRTGELDLAFAMFSFPTRSAYQDYRNKVRAEPECIAAERLLEESRCLLDYERTFVEPLA